MAFHGSISDTHRLEDEWLIIGDSDFFEELVLLLDKLCALLASTGEIGSEVGECHTSDTSCPISLCFLIRSKRDVVSQGFVPLGARPRCG